MIFSIVIGFVILLLIYFKFIIPYFKGKSFEVWHKVALISIYKKLQNEIRDERMRKTVFNFLLSNSKFEQDKKIKKFAEENAITISKKAVDLVSSDLEFYNLVVQTLFVQMGASVGYSNPEMRDQILDNPIFDSALNSNKFRPYNYREYAKLVEKFSEKEGIKPNN